MKYHEFTFGDDEAWDAHFETWNKESDRCARAISIHRQAKALTDIALNKWLDAGAQSAIDDLVDAVPDPRAHMHLKELWKFVHAEILAVLECYKK